MTRSVRSAWFLVCLPLLLGAGVSLSSCDRAPSAAGPQAPAASLDHGQVRLLLAALDQAPTHGFRRGAFGGDGLARLDLAAAAGQARLRQAVLAYARALHGGAVAARSFDPNWGLKPAPYDAAAEFRQALAGDRLAQWLETLPPASPRYQALRAGYLSYGRILAAGGWRPLPETPLKPGAAGPAVAALRQRLAIEDPAMAPAVAGDVFDAALADAVRRAQLRYGLKPTGLVDRDTLAALNLPVEVRLGQIRASLERLRWLPRAPSPTRIEVNSAAGVFDLYRDGRPAMHMLVAAGRPGDETPILTSAIDTIVFNPAWHVPDDIADKEILPRAARDPGYFQRENFVRNEPGKGVKIIQKPGPKNALGQVKFLFDNPYSVYLHDTPARSAFLRAQRSVSHGCVRLQHAVDLAKEVLSTQEGWDPGRVDDILASDETSTVKLRQPLPVTLVYLTAFPAAEGGLAFRQDVYGWDAEVLRLLDAAGSRHA